LRVGAFSAVVLRADAFGVEALGVEGLVDEGLVADVLRADVLRDVVLRLDSLRAGAFTDARLAAVFVFAFAKPALAELTFAKSQLRMRRAFYHASSGEQSKACVIRSGNTPQLISPQTRSSAPAK
jgi:hypothetical protein